MCGRFNVISDPLNRFIVEITGRGFELADQYNIAPTEQVPVLVRQAANGWELRMMRWWLIPSWASEPAQKYAMYNARSENLARSRAFREPFRHRRCVIPASGYYEWKKEGKARIPYYIEARDDDGLALAGLWDSWHGDDQTIESCSIVTAAAPAPMKEIHDRIPVHLTATQVGQWVEAGSDEKALASLLAPGMRVPLKVTPVSSWVNNARNKGPRCVEPVGDSVVIQ